MYTRRPKWRAPFVNEIEPSVLQKERQLFEQRTPAVLLGVAVVPVENALGVDDVAPRTTPLPESDSGDSTNAAAGPREPPDHQKYSTSTQAGTRTVLSFRLAAVNVRRAFWRMQSIDTPSGK